MEAFEGNLSTFQPKGWKFLLRSELNPMSVEISLKSKLNHLRTYIVTSSSFSGSLSKASS